MSDRKKRKISDHQSVGTDQVQEEKQNENDQSKESIQDTEENIQEFFQEEDEKQSDVSQNSQTEVKEQPQVYIYCKLLNALNNQK